ncbi:hypothetical protein OQH60_02855 [Campylobacter sp. MIT 21-1685]|uniref:hypothetical protein n=1 Tax=unclassified Campylobacter TaxID=2593542 RepID=UPI00224ADD87|nr:MULTISPECIES: hypothetical protein [unclassified Campylobacter]MCX2682805.1 hypothetical protein [Campylobacter sp. MIT 21-1684]MCX2751049.1 hypothetical protein [Campylobacter sp. MIT 21-1682]MCX2807286.1 hypothetical protein [Campylobacter sp. MIT 21-1685]
MLIYDKSTMLEFLWIDSFNFSRHFTNKKTVLCFFYDTKLIHNSQAKGFDFAVLIQNTDDIFLSNALGAKFLLFNDKKLAKFGAKAAEFYLFDSKTLLLVKKIKNLHKAYKIGLDGVIERNCIFNFKENKISQESLLISQSV